MEEGRPGQRVQNTIEAIPLIFLRSGEARSDFLNECRNVNGPIKIPSSFNGACLKYIVI